jgi:hypothetical protein
VTLPFTIDELRGYSTGDLLQEIHLAFLFHTSACIDNENPVDIWQIIIAPSLPSKQADQNDGNNVYKDFQTVPFFTHSISPLLQNKPFAGKCCRKWL